MGHYNNSSNLLQFCLSPIVFVFHFDRLPFWSSSILVFFHFGRLPFWSSSILVVFHFGRLPFGVICDLCDMSYPPAQLNGATLPHSSTVLSSRTAQRSYPPAQLNSLILPHSSTVLPSRTAQRRGGGAKSYSWKSNKVDHRHTET